MNIGIRLHDTLGKDMEESLALAKGQGFSCAHIAMQRVTPGFRMMDAPTLLTQDLADETVAKLKKYDIQPAVLGCYLNLGTPDLEELERSYACYRAHLRFGRMIGAKVVGTETGDLNTTYTFDPSCRTEEALQLFIQRVRPIARWAEEEGQLFAIEPVIRHIVCSVERAERVLEAIDSPNLRIILDSVNLLDPANCDDADKIVDDAIRRLGDRIEVLHMKDFHKVLTGDEVPAGACGTGIMNYTSLLKFAKAHEGLPMTLEDTVPANAEAARLHLEKLAAAL